MEIKDSVVVVTGASSGIGRATALALAGEGARLVLAARREEPLQDVARACEEAGAQALVVPTEMADEPSVEHLARRAIDHYGRIDVWVNNAAVTLIGRIEDVPMAEFRRVVEVNLFGYVHGARCAIPHFRNQGGGILVNVASQVANGGQPYASAYVASKYAVRGLSEALRMELGDEGVEVCTVLPASVDTPLFQHAANYSGRVVRPLPPVYTAEEVAAAILDVVREPRREVSVGGAAAAVSAVRAVSPRLYERLMTRAVERNHFEDRAAAPDSGNLWHSDPDARIDGGWGGKDRRARSRLARVGAAAALLVASPLAVRWLGPQRTLDLVKKTLPLAARAVVGRR